MAQKFTETLLTRLDRKDAGKVIADAGYSGTGTGRLLARVAKSGRVSFYVKFQDTSAKSGQRKMLLNDRHLHLKQHGIRAFLKEYGVGDLRKMAEDAVKELTSTAGGRRTSPMTVARMKNDYIARRSSPAFAFRGRQAKDNLRAVELMFERAIKVWGADTLVRNLTKTDAKKLLVYIAENHGPAAANRTKASLVKPLKFVQRDDKAVDVNNFRSLDLDPALYAVKPRPARKGGHRRTGIYTETAEYFRLIYLCAARKGEAEFMVWGEVNFDKGTWLMPEPKRKNQEHKMYLPAEAIAVLKRQRARYPNASEENRVFPMINHADAWADFQTIRAMADITSDLTIHDLRASRVTQWATEGDSPKIEAELAAIFGSKDVKGLIRVYVLDSASEEEKRARVNAADDAELVG